MGSFEIPKEIKSKPKMMGLEMRELVILLLGFMSIFTIFKDMIHGLFVIPFMIIASLVLLWSVMPSSNNPSLRNYTSLLLFFKRDKYTYHAISHFQVINKEVIAHVEKEMEEKYEERGESIAT